MCAVLCTSPLLCIWPPWTEGMQKDCMEQSLPCTPRHTTAKDGGKVQILQEQISVSTSCTLSFMCSCINDIHYGDSRDFLGNCSRHYSTSYFHVVVSPVTLTHPCVSSMYIKKGAPKCAFSKFIQNLTLYCSYQSKNPPTAKVWASCWPPVPRPILESWSMYSATNLSQELTSW